MTLILRSGLRTGLTNLVFSPVKPGSKLRILVGCGLLICGIAFVDRIVVEDVPLGFLYLMPMMVLGRFLRPWQILLVAVVCTTLTEAFDQFSLNLRATLPRDALYFIAFFATAIFVREVSRYRNMALAHLHETALQNQARIEAEQQLHSLVESNPAAILMADADGSVLMANEAAYRLLEVQQPLLLGRSIDHHFPSLANISHFETTGTLFRTVMQTRGHREHGESFLAEVCFSTYRTVSGPRFAAMILDTSEELRTREESVLQQMLAGSRIAASAISHEVRNVCGAIAAVHQNLASMDAFQRNNDFESLGNLVKALERIAAVDLRPYEDQASEIDLSEVVEDLRIVITPSLCEADISCDWLIEPDIPLVWADRSNLIQVFLNLTTNSIRALSQIEGERKLSIVARKQARSVLIEVRDNGPGIPQPEELFRPFQEGAHNTGLGLYLARAFARSFGGDLRHQHSSQGGACFIVELLAAAESGDPT